jgi:two-component system response regulator
VEDNPSSQELTLRAFRANHLAHHVQIVSDGAEALDYVFCRGKHADRDPRDPPVLVVLDLKLPQVDGLEVLRQLRARESTRLVPVVIFSASRSESDIRKGYELGASGYVVKPVDYGEFTRVIGDIGRYWLGINIPPNY